MKDVRGFEAIELEASRPLDARERFHALAGREVSRSLIAVADDHPNRLCHRITRYVMRNNTAVAKDAICGSDEPLDDFAGALSVDDAALAVRFKRRFNADFFFWGERRRFIVHRLDHIAACRKLVK